MSRQWNRIAALFALLLAFCATQAYGQNTNALSFGALISEGMVVQQGTPVRIYGKATPGARVVVAMQSKSGTTNADAQGNWTATLPPLKPGGPFTLTATSGGETRMIGDVLVGEVWICSGQSNMEWAMASSKGGPEEAATAKDPELRMFTVPHNIQTTPQESLPSGSWQPVDPANTPRFSGVGYYFAKELRRTRKVPVGMIFTAWGGTRIQAWMRRDILAAVPGVPASDFDPLDPSGEFARGQKARYDRQLAAWQAAGSPKGGFTDPGMAASARSWALPETPTEDWKTLRIGQVFSRNNIEELEYIDGAVWVRRELTIPAAYAGKKAVLSLGTVDDSDITFFNGVQVGSGSGSQVRRKYEVPANLVRAGRNVIAVRVWDGNMEGGVVGPNAELHLSIPEAEGAPVLPITGNWRYKIELARPTEPARNNGLNPNVATVLYNGMIAPFTRYTVKGAIWYQGESNSGQADLYASLMPAMIQNWRTDFANPDMYFYMVQLAAFGSGNSLGTNYAQTREAQLHTTKVLKNVGMAVITDVGDEIDIHPRDKTTVGTRLAALARKYAYRETLVAAAPEPSQIQFVGNGVVRIRFANVADGLNVKGGTEIKGFTVAGADGNFKPATARLLDKSTVEVVAVTRPTGEADKITAVRFGFVNFDGTLNLFNSEGNPATPFRSDTAPWFGKK